MRFRAWLLKWGVSLWPPLLGAGIRVEQLDSDFKFARVRMKLRWFNQNHMGKHFGGSLYAMTDPFYVLMVSERLGKDYVVWDKTASIDYIKPGDSTVWAEFRLPQGFLDKVKANTQNGAKYLPEFDVLIKNDSGDVVARVKRTIYIRRQQSRHKTQAAPENKQDQIIDSAIS